MKKIFTIGILGVLLLSNVNADNIITTKEQAVEIGKSMSSSINMAQNKSFEDRIKMCEDIANSTIILNSTNRAEVLPILISSCKVNIKK